MIYFLAFDEGCFWVDESRLCGNEAYSSLQEAKLLFKFQTTYKRLKSSVFLSSFIPTAS